VFGGMKIAIVGKGGSGKSTTSWLLSMYLSRVYSVLAIDADHNMDLASILGFEVKDDTRTFHRVHGEFQNKVGLEQDSKWSRIVSENRILPQFSFQPPDAFTQSISYPIHNNLSLQIVGLGAEDILYSDRCAHGHSAPLKFYLPLLDEGDNQVIIDGVAGADMLHFGLFCGADALVGVVEPHINSKKVFEQLRVLSAKLDIPFYGILNKPRDNDLYHQIKQEYTDILLGEIPIDEAIIEYNFEGLDGNTNQALENIWSELQSRYVKVDTLARLRDFESKRAEKAVM
jgi:CO dehydrogenase maturation factor